MHRHQKRNGMSRASTFHCSGGNSGCRMLEALSAVWRWVTHIALPVPPGALHDMTQVRGTQFSPRCCRHRYQAPKGAKSVNVTDIMLQYARIAPRQPRPAVRRSISRNRVSKYVLGAHLKDLWNVLEDCVRHGGAALCREGPEEVWSAASEGTAATTTRWHGRQTNIAQLRTPTSTLLALSFVALEPVCEDDKSVPPRPCVPCQPSLG